MTEQQLSVSDDVVPEQTSLVYQPIVTKRASLWII